MGGRSERGHAVTIHDCTIVGNDTGIDTTNAAQVRLAGTTISRNATGIAYAAGGLALSQGNNLIDGNTADGAAPIVVGAIVDGRGVAPQSRAMADLAEPLVALQVRRCPALPPRACAGPLDESARSSRGAAGSRRCRGSGRGANICCTCPRAGRAGGARRSSSSATAASRRRRNSRRAPASPRSPTRWAALVLMPRQNENGQRLALLELVRRRDRERSRRGRDRRRDDPLGPPLASRRSGAHRRGRDVGGRRARGGARPARRGTRARGRGPLGHRLRRRLVGVHRDRRDVSAARKPTSRRSPRPRARRSRPRCRCSRSMARPTASSRNRTPSRSSASTCASNGHPAVPTPMHAATSLPPPDAEHHEMQGGRMTTTREWSPRRPAPRALRVDRGARPRVERRRRRAAVQRRAGPRRDGARRDVRARRTGVR